MNKVFGIKSDYALVRREASRTVVCYDYNEEEDGVNATWFEVYLYKNKVSQPTLEQIKVSIQADIDSQTDDKSWHDFKFEGKPVCLEKSYRDDFKAVHDAAFMYPESVTFPQLFKLSEDEEHNAVYHEFASMEELAQFYLGGLNWISYCVAEGWRRKAAINYDDYEKLL